MAVLEAERVADLVDHRVVVVIAGDRVAPGVAEPDVAAGDAGVGIVAVGGARVGVVGEAERLVPMPWPAKKMSRLVKPSTEKPA